MPGLSWRQSKLSFLHRHGNPFVSHDGAAEAPHPSRGGTILKRESAQRKILVGKEITEDIRDRLRRNFMFVSLDDETISALVLQFEMVEYEPGETIIEQGRAGKDEPMYYYMLIAGECDIIKDGKKLPGSFGTLEPGSQFGEQSVLFNESKRGATIIASKASAKSNTIVLYQLDGATFREMMDQKELKKLQIRIKDVIKVFDTLSGVDTKIAGTGTIIRPYEPSRRWLASSWRGTILQYIWPGVLGMMAFTGMFGLVVELSGPNDVGQGIDVEDIATGSVLYHLELILEWWWSLQLLTTFVSTFFLTAAFKFWNRFYWTTRAIQGRFNDISLLVACTSARGEDRKLTSAAIQCLDDIARIQRLLHTLYWSSVVKRFSAFHSPEGISYLLSFNLINLDEYDSLIEATSSGFGGHNAAMTWLTSRIWLAKKNGEIEADSAAMQTIFDKITHLRALMARIPDMYDGRMPLAYVHFVNMLVMTLIMLSPFSLFAVLYYWAVPAVGVLTLFYGGIFTLSLMFLDPVDNDAQHQKYAESAGFDVGVLIREANAGSVRYSKCAALLPKNYLIGPLKEDS